MRKLRKLKLLLRERRLVKCSNKSNRVRDMDEEIAAQQQQDAQRRFDFGRRL